MATAPVSRKLNLTRDQLAAFLTDQQQIRQFELLFATVDQLQVIVGSDFEYQADNAAATANEALAQISALAQDTAVDDAVLNAKVQQALDSIPRLAQALDLLIQQPAATGGTVTRVGLALPSEFAVTNSPVTTSGTLTAAFTTQSANSLFAGPTSGAGAVPTFRALTTADIPALPYGTGTVTSVGLSLPSIMAVTNSPVTTSGTLTGTLTTQAVNSIFAGPSSGSAAAPTFRALTTADIPALLYGDVFGPASATDNAVARFDLTTGKLIQNSVVTIGDTGATTGITTLAASTSVTTPIVQASNSAGLSLKNASGTTQMSVGAGGGDNMSINVSTNLNGTNAQIDISPTGTGHVHIKPTGTGSVEVAPTNVGTIDNMTIGASTPKNASFVDLSVTGTLSFDAAQGTAGQVLTSSGTGITPTWTTPTTGTVTSASVVSANGFAGTVATATTTPAITLTTTITGLLNGNGTAISAAVVNTDYFAPSAPVTKTADFTVAATEVWLINNKSGSTCTVTLPTASSWTGRVLRFQNYQAQTVVSASSNVVPLTGGAAATSILLASSGDSATLVSDGSNWLMTQYVPNNILLLE